MAQTGHGRQRTAYHLHSRQNWIDGGENYEDEEFAWYLGVRSGQRRLGTMLAVLVLVCSLATGLVGARQFDPRERFEAPPPPARVSGRMMRTLMKNKVWPSCSESARKRKLKGEVFLFLRVNDEGRVSNIRVISGEPGLAELGVEAASRLRFRPYNLNGEAVPFEGPIKYGLQCR